MSKFDHLKGLRSSEGYWIDEQYFAVAKEVIAVTQASDMLEIGFNIGYSATAWLSTNINSLYIIDIGKHGDTRKALKRVKEHFPNKSIEWTLADSMSEEAKEIDLQVDLSFIDGAHTEKAVISDTKLSIAKGAKWLVFDDLKDGLVVSNTIKNEIPSNVLEEIKTWEVSYRGHTNKVGLFRVRDSGYV